MAITMDAREAPRGPVLKGSRDAAERARAFRRARRHSLLVKMLRVALPVAAAGIAGFYALTLGLSWQMGPGRLKIGEMEVTADDLTMKDATYFGLTKDGGRYEVRAKKAIVEFNKEAPIKLIDIDGDLLQANDVTTKLKAKHGLLDNAKSELELYDGIEIDASNGMQARMSRAMVYSKEHRIVSKHPVDLSMPNGRVQGATMTMRSDTREATFVGDVKAHLVSTEQPGQRVPSSPAFGRDSKHPIDVTADQLYVNDFAKTALFMGKVVAVQGDSTLKAPELHIAYEGRAAADAMTAAAQPQQPEEASRLSRLVAKDGVVVTVGVDRRVASDQVEFDAKADTALFVGDVLVNQQKNVLQGQRLFIDRKAGTSRLETPAEGTQPAGRIAATFYQNDTKGAAQPKSKPKSIPDHKDGAMQDGVLGSFKMDPNAPMDVEADTLDVYDNEKRAVFHGNVKTKQGDFVVRTKEMVAFYSAGLGLASGRDGAADKTPAQLTRIEAKQKVLIISKDGQSATGDWAIFDTKANTVLLGDDVTISRGKDVAQGPRLKIDLTTGMYRFELEQEPAVAPAAPATSASPQLTAPAPPSSNPAERACAPGRQCLLVYPKDAQDRAKGAVDKVLPGSSAAKTGEAWLPSTSASPTLRGD
jgi:LPS export ABC transporter protein LptC/lipopolysaccharide transport protein LptA